MLIIRLLFLTGGAGLFGAIFWAKTADGRSLGALLAEMAAQPWSVVTLIDLYLGFLFSAAIILAAERRWSSRLFWAIPIFLLGNLWTVVWLALRLPGLVGRLRRST